MLCGGRDGSGGGVGGALCLPDIDAADGRLLTLTKGKARVVAIDTKRRGYSHNVWWMSIPGPGDHLGPRTRLRS